jgi:steroid delta-isomerase-like uncharacterized protein
MTADEIAAFFDRRAKAFARSDPEALSNDYADDAVLHSPTTGIVVGRSGIEQVYRVWMRAFPDLKMETEELIIAGHRVAQVLTASGTDTGGFLGFAPSGKPFRVPCVFLFELNDNQIVRERRIYDRGGVLLQLVGEGGTVDEMRQLYREALERARLECEIKVAADIQAALLPKHQYSSPHFDVVATSVPCRAIGGDFFDYVESPDGTFGFVLADVAGKGPPAALLTAVLQGIFRAHINSGSSPADIMARVNDSLLRRAIESRFATVLYATLSCDGRLTYCNAGHNPPLLFGADGLRRRLEKGGLIVGAFKQATFEEETLQLDPGDTLVVFSDGISEALNSDGEEFGEDRLVRCVEANRALPPGNLLECVLEKVQDFRADAVQNDDLTVLILRTLTAHA